MSIFNRNKECKKVESMEIIEIYFKNGSIQSYSSPNDGLAFSDAAVALQKWWERKNDVFLFPYTSGMILLKKDEISYIDIYVEEE